MIVGGIAFFTVRIGNRISIYYEYQAKIGNYLDLSKRASTISQKSEYINKFVSALEKEELEGINDALFYPTGENSFDENFKALKSLQIRLKDIDSMDENSFAYQTAIHQITEQEQGMAESLKYIINNCWQKKYHYTYWNNLIGISFLIVQFLLVMIGICLYNEC